jgi:3-oxoacyl-[acyl-carrier-protein] synthase-1
MTAAASAAAVRAGISGYTEHPFLFDSAGNPYIVAQTPYLPIDLVGVSRLVELTGPAISEALVSFAMVKGAKPRIPIFIGIPAPRPGRPPETANTLVRSIQESLSHARLEAGDITVIEAGHSAGAIALHEAFEKVHSGAFEFALCGGVDSYFEPETMTWLEAAGQIHGADYNSWGFVPGEASAFVLLTSARGAKRYNMNIALKIITTAIAKEGNLIKSDAVCIGEGLSDLFRALAADLPADSKVDQLFCDMNGEPYRADEFGFASLRAGEMFRNPEEFATPAVSWGDTGAASGPLFLILAEAAARRRYGSGPLIAAFTSAESGERCGFVARIIEPQ